MNTPSIEAAPGETFGARLRRFRLARGLSLSALAATTGISKGYLSSIETSYHHVGQRPSGKTLFALADALGVSVFEMYGREFDDELEISPSLREYATQYGVPGIEVNMLASIRFAGAPPCTANRWWFLHAAINASESLDR